MDSQMNTGILKGIICGYERGGTTVLSQTLRRHPRLDAGFEGGFLLAKRPSDFLSRKFRTYNGHQIRGGWHITDEELRYICHASNWNEVYLRLREKSRLIKDKTVYLIDKTPRYMMELDVVLDRMPGIPCIVVVRNPRSVIWSWIKRLFETDEKTPYWKLRILCHRYVRYAQGYHRALRNHHERITTIGFSSLCRSPETELDRVFNTLGLKMERDYLSFDPKYGVRGSRISPGFLREYERHLSEKTLTRIDHWTRKAGWTVSDY